MLGLSLAKKVIVDYILLLTCCDLSLRSDIGDYKIKHIYTFFLKSVSYMFKEPISMNILLKPYWISDISLFLRDIDCSTK